MEVGTLKSFSVDEMSPLPVPCYINEIPGILYEYPNEN